MKIKSPVFVLFVLSSTLVLRSAAIPLNDLLGIAPEDEKYYAGLWSSGTIKCKDGSKTFTKSQLNDDFCDCFDGTDEPGTSACPAGKFYCRNAGHRPLTVFSSRVNDRICDCCDGSDEYDGKTRCKNTCWEAGKVARDRLMEKIKIYVEGVSIRDNEVEQAKLSFEQDKENLLKLKHEEKTLKGIVQNLKDHKDRIEKAVKKERIQKEKEEQQKKESELKEHKGEEKVDVAEKESTKSKKDDKDGILNNSPSGQNLNKDPAADVAQNAHTSHDNVQQHAAKEEESSDVTHATEDIDSLSKEDLGREIGSRWTGKKTEHQNHDDETPVNVHNEENNGDNTETDDDDDDEHYEEDLDDHRDVQEDTHDDSSSSHDYDPDEYEDISDIESASSPSLIEKIQQTVRNFLLAVNPFQTPVNTSEAESVQKEYDEASEKLSKVKTKISRITKKLANDFGPEKEFYLLHGRCFETKQNKYVYKVCPFKQATQEEGYSTTNLGRWDKFVDSYSVMLFSNGDNCWNGPDRSLKVRLRCGSKVELSDIDEPSRCEYEAMLTTPALCLEEKLKELEDELEFMDKDKLQFHDEL
ncbi:glucosidase 2 subunit beta [Lactuca sativa]|uniref:glucosidase 2 subunit beta n=1 Tax=Lactuca sativa TaxID=4236 RepID=UPI000CD906F7|nr:glucosidase 2 subunit beta [Lactuca sativa]